MIQSTTCFAMPPEGVLLSSWRLRGHQRSAVHQLLPELSCRARQARCGLYPLQRPFVSGGACSQVTFTRPSDLRHAVIVALSHPPPAAWNDDVLGLMSEAPCCSRYKPTWKPCVSQDRSFWPCLTMRQDCARLAVMSYLRIPLREVLPLSV